jgi:hypothetical protein
MMSVESVFQMLDVQDVRAGESESVPERATEGSTCHAGGDGKAENTTPAETDAPVTAAAAGATEAAALVMALPQLVAADADRTWAAVTALGKPPENVSRALRNYRGAVVRAANTLRNVTTSVFAAPPVRHWLETGSALDQCVCVVCGGEGELSSARRARNGVVYYLCSVCK